MNTEMVRCVKHRDGWCATATGEDFAEGAHNVPTACGYFVTLPFGSERRVPDCAECLAVAALDPADVARKMERATAQVWALRALAVWEGVTGGWTGESPPPTPRELSHHDARRRNVPSWRYRATTDSERMAAALSGLAKRLLAVRLGKAADGSRTWALTDLGRRVAAAVEAEAEATP